MWHSAPRTAPIHPRDHPRGSGAPLGAKRRGEGPAGTAPRDKGSRDPSHPAPPAAPAARTHAEALGTLQRLGDLAVLQDAEALVVLDARDLVLLLRQESGGGILLATVGRPVPGRRLLRLLSTEELHVGHRQRRTSSCGSAPLLRRAAARKGRGRPSRANERRAPPAPPNQRSAVAGPAERKPIGAQRAAGGGAGRSARARRSQAAPAGSAPSGSALSESAPSSCGGIGPMPACHSTGAPLGQDTGPSATWRQIRTRRMRPEQRFCQTSFSRDFACLLSDTGKLKSQKRSKCQVGRNHVGSSGSMSLLKQGPPGAFGTGLCLYGSRTSPVRENSHPVWTICSNAQSPTQQNSFSYSSEIYCTSVFASCLMS